MTNHTSLFTVVTADRRNSWCRWPPPFSSSPQQRKAPTSWLAYSQALITLYLHCYQASKINNINDVLSLQQQFIINKRKYFLWLRLIFSIAIDMNKKRTRKNELEKTNSESNNSWLWVSQIKSSDIRDQLSNSWLLNQTHLSNQSSDKQLISSPNRWLEFQTAD